MTCQRLQSQPSNPGWLQCPASYHQHHLSDSTEEASHNVSLRNQVSNTREWCSNSQTGVFYSTKVTIGENLCKLDCHVSYAMHGAHGPSPLLTGSEGLSKRGGPGVAVDGRWSVRASALFRAFVVSFLSRFPSSPPPPMPTPPGLLYLSNTKQEDCCTISYLPLPSPSPAHMRMKLGSGRQRGEPSCS